MRALGYGELRVRHHGELGKLELPEADLERALAQRAAIVEAIRAAGYRHAAIDLEPFRSGRLSAVFVARLGASPAAARRPRCLIYLTGLPMRSASAATRAVASRISAAMSYVDELAVALAHDAVDPDVLDVARLRGEHDLAVGDVERPEVDVVGAQHDQVGLLAGREAAGDVAEAERARAVDRALAEHRSGP